MATFLRIHTYCQDLHAARLADDMRADLLRREEVRFSYVSYAVSTLLRCGGFSDEIKPNGAARPT